jgi:alpha-beta hydrolase superfamily lysophospholipase
VPFFDGVSGPVYYRHWDAASPRAAVVFLHGFGEHTGVYHRFGAALNQADIDLWALDEIGHGLTGGRRGEIESIDALVSNGQRLTDLAAQAGLPLVIAGHSLGAVAAMITTLRHPDRYRAAVLSGATLSMPQWFADLESAGDAFALDLDDLSGDPFYRDSLENDPLAFTEADIVGVLRRALPPAWAEVNGAIGDLRIPVLALNGSEDAVAPVADVAAVAARSAQIRTLVFEGMRHDILNERVHREVAAAITAFVRNATG